jgi:hypothetical protein
MRNTYNILVGKLEGKNSFENLGVCGRSERNMIGGKL